jgi:hypothetical protein
MQTYNRPKAKARTIRRVTEKNRPMHEKGSSMEKELLSKNGLKKTGEHLFLDEKPILTI